MGARPSTEERDSLESSISNSGSMIESEWKPTNDIYQIPILALKSPTRRTSPSLEKSNMSRYNTKYGDASASSHTMRAKCDVSGGEVADCYKDVTS